jgi:FkbM family methyltransferase
VTPARLKYYAASLPTLLWGVRNWPATALGLLRGRRGRGFVVELRNGCRFKVTTALDLWILKEVCLDREYERYGTTIRNGWSVVDIGAGLGEFCIQVAREHPDCRVYAFEPGPESFALLRENVDLNGVRNVSLFPSAVGRRAGVSVLRLEPDARARASTVTAAGAQPAAQVPTTTLGDILRDLDIARCDFLKIDCEGGEYDILMGADAATLQRIAHMSVEYHDGVTPLSGADLAAWLERQGFQVRRVPNPAYPRTLGWLYAANTRPG